LRPREFLTLFRGTNVPFALLSNRRATHFAEARRFLVGVDRAPLGCPASERISDVITRLAGSMGFLLAQLILMAGWSLVNLHWIPGLRAFDPFPFGVLALIVSAEGVFLTTFVTCKSAGCPNRN
jgi:hypothetical protein